ncbi:MAG: hypothetical protein ACK55I_15470, partial [bacterium]
VITCAAGRRTPPGRSLQDNHRVRRAARGHHDACCIRPVVREQRLARAVRAPRDGPAGSEKRCLQLVQPVPVLHYLVGGAAQRVVQVRRPSLNGGDHDASGVRAELERRRPAQDGARVAVQRVT